MAKKQKKKTRSAFSRSLAFFRNARENRKWFYKKWFELFSKGLSVTLVIIEIINYSFINVEKFFIWILACILVVGIITAIISWKAMSQYLVKSQIVNEEKCESIVVSVADSYLTNALKLYPESTMIFGINAAFYFKEAMDKSLLQDFIDEFCVGNGIDVEEVQKQIDEELSKEEYASKKIGQVSIRGEERTTYPIGTIVDIRLTCVETRESRRVCLIANSCMYEPIRVYSDDKDPVAEHFDEIWQHFLTAKGKIDNELLIPTIGAGVADEKYSDLYIYCKLVDYYFEYVQKYNKGETVKCAIPRMVISIRDTAAIHFSKKDKGVGRHINLEDAYQYIDYKMMLRKLYDN